MEFRIVYGLVVDVRVWFERDCTACELSSSRCSIPLFEPVQSCVSDFEFFLSFSFSRSVRLCCGSGRRLLMVVMYGVVRWLKLCGLVWIRHCCDSLEAWTTNLCEFWSLVREWILVMMLHCRLLLLCWLIRELPFCICIFRLCKLWKLVLDAIVVLDLQLSCWLFFFCAGFCVVNRPPQLVFCRWYI